jgi:hypothetical protein
MTMSAKRLIRMVLPLLLGGAILYWMYRGFDWQGVRRVLADDMAWGWMLLSMPFGVLAQLLRGWRWRQLLEPMGERPRRRVLARAIFLSYASSLVVPRIGEFLRCGVLARWEGVPFPKAVGTVVTERAIDTILMGLFTLATLLLQMSAFGTFFRQTGTTLGGILSSFSWAGYGVTAVCLVAIVVLLYLLMRRLAVAGRVSLVLQGLWQGVASIRQVRNIPLFVFFSLGIWVCYFLHFYLTFFCFAETARLGMDCALVCFVVGTIAVVVPTPNGAGPWHFAVKTMLILYGVTDGTALNFVLIVHTLQTLLVVLLGVWAWTAMALTDKRAGD